MFLAVDIGNTQTVLGFCSDSEWSVYRVDTIDEWTHDIINELTDGKLAQVADCWLSSVVPTKTAYISDSMSKLLEFNVNVINENKHYLSLPIKVANPQEIGKDLVCNAVAGYEKFKNDCIVIDFGTALTFTMIKERTISGVSIAPGLKTAMGSLINNAAQLQNIPLHLPKDILGSDTTSAIQSGILWGYVGMVEGMISRIEKHHGELKIVATGGLSEVLEPLQSSFDEVDRTLTLEGIRLIGKFNS